MRTDARIPHRILSSLPAQENQLIIDCYHNDITAIVEGREGARIRRKLHNAKRYAKRHGRQHTTLHLKEISLRVFTWRDPMVGGIPDAESA